MDRCSPVDPTARCEWRYTQVMRGRFEYRWGHGWVWKDARRPDVTWDICPGCGEQLCDLHDAAIDRVLGWMERGWPTTDTFDGEEGG